MHPITRLLLAATLPLALGACSAGMAGYPSLAQRPAERAYATVPPAAPAPAPVAATPDPAVIARLARLRSDAERAHQAFVRQAEEAERLAGAPLARQVGSEAWAAANTAVAALSAARSQTAVPLADLDSLQGAHAVDAAAAQTGVAAATFAAVVEADRAVSAMVAMEDARIAALKAMVGE